VLPSRRTSGWRPEPIGYGGCGVAMRSAASALGLILLSLGSDFCISSHDMVPHRNPSKVDARGYPCRELSMRARCWAGQRGKEARITKILPVSTHEYYDGTDSTSITHLSARKRATALKLRGGSGPGLPDNAAASGQIADCGRYPFSRLQIQFFWSLHGRLCS